MTRGFGDDLASGRLPNLDAVLQVREDVGPAGRSVDVRVIDGIAVRVLPDRGLDIGPAWYRGVPLAWVSKVGETAALTQPTGMEWSSAFGGGLVTTCGLRNVGAPSEGHGLHGTYSHLAAHDVAVSRNLSGSVVVSGRVEDDAGGEAPLRLERTIVTHAGAGRVEITDRTVNMGDVATPAPILYHVNFGHPVWSAGSELHVASHGDPEPRDDDSLRSVASWDRPHPIEVGPERVLEHRVAPVDGWGEATVVSHAHDIAVSVRWRVDALPRLHQWIDPNPGMAVLGIEPANCSTSGRAVDRAEGRLPVLGPGETRTTRLQVLAQPAT